MYILEEFGISLKICYQMPGFRSCQRKMVLNFVVDLKIKFTKIGIPYM